MPQPERWALDTVAGPRTLEEIDSILVRAWSEHPQVPQAVRTQVGIAVAEIGANVVEHAGRAGAVRIRMRLRVLPGEVWVEFADDGPPARVDLGAVVMPDDMAERGRGLALAQAVLGSLAYRRDALNHWTLVSKRFG